MNDSDIKLPVKITQLINNSQLFNLKNIRSMHYRSLAGQAGKSHQLFQIGVQYENNDQKNQLTQFFIKFGKSSKENFFYTSISKELKSSLLPICYYAEYNPDLNQTGLILEDLSFTHSQTDWPLPPSDKNCLLTVQKLADIHAAHWQAPCLENEFRIQIPSDRSWTGRRKHAVDKIPDFLDFIGNRISRKNQKIYQSLKLSANNLLIETETSPFQTLLHGDMHAWNVFYPRDTSAEICFIDWNMWDIGIPTDDLAYFIAIHWYPERRKRLEQKMLVSYHEKLKENGVHDYTWDKFFENYRRSVTLSLLTPVWQWIRGIEPCIWWPHLECICQAFDDLKCSDFFELKRDH